MSRFRDWLDAPSESKALTELLSWLSASRDAIDQHLAATVGRVPEGLGEARHAIRRAEEIAVTLRDLASRGIHSNPPLVIFGNPPMRGPQHRGVSGGRPGTFEFAGMVSRDVHEVRYTHMDDHKAYRHVFDSGDVQMYAIIRGREHRDVLLTGGSGQPLWKDFD